MRSKIKTLSFPKVDKRLLGTWKLDEKKTLKEWTWKRRITPRKKKRFGEILGKSAVTYTRTKVIFTKKETGWHSERHYVVAAADETSVAIVQFGETKIKNRRKYDPYLLRTAEDLFPSKVEIRHIHFEKSGYWISWGKNRGFFRRIIPAGILK